MADQDEPHKPLTLTVDWELYAHHLENSDLSDADKEKLIQTLWFIVVNFVDFGFGVEAAQSATGALERTDEQIALHAFLDSIETETLKEDETTTEKEDACHH